MKVEGGSRMEERMGRKEEGRRNKIGRKQEGKGGRSEEMEEE